MAALTAAMLALSAANTVGKVAGDRRAASIAEGQGNAQGGLLDMNATLADNQAANATARGDQAASRVQRRGDLLAGEQRTAFAGQGIDTGSGSAAEVMSQDRGISELDALQIKNNAALEALGYKTQATGYRTQADWARTAGANEAAALRRRTFSTLLGGAAELASIYQTSPKKVSRAPTVPSPTDWQD